MDSLSEPTGPTPTYLDLLRITADTVAEGMTVLVKGTVMACGLTQEIFTRTNIERAFDGALHQLSWDDNVLAPEAG